MVGAILTRNRKSQTKWPQGPLDAAGCGTQDKPIRRALPRRGQKRSGVGSVPCAASPRTNLRPTLRTNLSGSLASPRAICAKGRAPDQESHSRTPQEGPRGQRIGERILAFRKKQTGLCHVFRHAPCRSGQVHHGPLRIANVITWGRLFGFLFLE